MDGSAVVEALGRRETFLADMKALIKRALASLGHRIQGTRDTPRQLLEPRNLRAIELADVIYRRMFEFGQELTFIQIGAFDGITADPLHKYVGTYGWRGVLVEPQPRSAEQLRELYRGNDRIVVVQAAVDRERRQRTLFTVESENAPAWAGGMASFQREHIAKHAYLIPGLEAMIRETTVDCVTIDDVLALLPPGQVDLLQIDVEGADAFLLSLFPFDRVRPAIVHWEIKNLTMAEREDCLERLLGFGYRFASSGDEDMMAVLDMLMKRLRTYARELVDRAVLQLVANPEVKRTLDMSVERHWHLKAQASSNPLLRQGEKFYSQNDEDGIIGRSSSEWGSTVVCLSNTAAATAWRTTRFSC